MMPQVVAKSLDLLIVLPKIFIVFPNQFPTLKEKPLLGAALGFPPEQVNEGGQDAGSHGQCGPRPQQEAGQAILEAGPEMNHQLTPPCGIGRSMDTAYSQPHSQDRQEQRGEQPVEAVPPLSPNQGEDRSGQQAQKPQILRYHCQQRSGRGPAQQCGQTVESRCPPQNPAQPPVAPAPQKEQQRGQAQGAAQSVQIHFRVWEIVTEKAGGPQRDQHEEKGGQREYEKANVPTTPEALPQKRSGEQKPQHKAEGRRDGSPEALCHDAALIGISAAQRHRAGVNGRLHLRDLLFPQAGGLGNGQGFTQIVRGQGDLHRLQPVPAQHGQRQLSHPAGLLRTVRVEALPIQEHRHAAVDRVQI